MFSGGRRFRFLRVPSVWLFVVWLVRLVGCLGCCLCIVLVVVGCCCCYFVILFTLLRVRARTHATTPRARSARWLLLRSALRAFSALPFQRFYFAAGSCIRCLCFVLVLHTRFSRLTASARAHAACCLLPAGLLRRLPTHVCFTFTATARICCHCCHVTYTLLPLCCVRTHTRAYCLCTTYAPLPLVPYWFIRLSAVGFGFACVRCLCGWDRQRHRHTRSRFCTAYRALLVPAYRAVLLRLLPYCGSAPYLRAPATARVIAFTVACNTTSSSCIVVSFLPYLPAAFWFVFYAVLLLYLTPATTLWRSSAAYPFA